MTLFSAACLVLGAGPACAEAPNQVSAPPWIRSDWGENAYWSSGQTEVDTYDTTTILHGHPRASTMMALFSAAETTADGTAEAAPPAAGPAVPAASPGGRHPALKMTIVSEQIDTPAFPYDLASTVLADRRNPAHVLSSVVTSHDWNGIIAKRYVAHPSPLIRVWNTTSPGDYERTLPPDVVPLEAVPLFLRAMDFSTTATFRCLPTLMAHRAPWSGAAPDPDVLDLRAAVDATETTTTAAGTFDCYRVKVTNPKGLTPMTLWIEKAFPNRMVYKTTISGKIFSLRHSERRPLPPTDPR